MWLPMLQTVWIAINLPRLDNRTDTFMPYTSLISVTDLAQLLANPAQPVVLLDASHDLFDAQAGRRAYDAAHLPGAYFISMDQEVGGVKTGQNGRHPLPERHVFVDVMRRFGIDDSTQVIVYDNSQGTHASRVWWTLRWLGHKAVAVLDGGIQAWQAAGHPVTADVPSLPLAGNFSDRGEAMVAVSYEEVLANLADQKRLVMDARAADRFRGENETLDPVGGHIPGAINRFYRLNLTEDGTFKSPDLLKAEFKAAIGERSAQDLIMQCGSGVSACHNLLALEWIGMGTAPLYVGSWSEWCSRDGAPIATGER